ncbi:unnamed protein product [Arctogadus glacialis]
MSPAQYQQKQGFVAEATAPVATISTVVHRSSSRALPVLRAFKCCEQWIVLENLAIDTQLHRQVEGHGSSDRILHLRDYTHLTHYLRDHTHLTLRDHTHLTHYLRDHTHLTLRDHTHLTHYMRPHPPDPEGPHPPDPLPEGPHPPDSEGPHPPDPQHETTPT